MKILSIDFGLKRMGIALGDSTINSATPLTAIIRQKHDRDINQLNDIIEEYGAEKIIMGYPLNMDGTKSPMTQRVENFAKHLRQATGLVVEFVDERLTSFEAEEMLKADILNYKKRKKLLDSISALIILRSYLENLERQ